MTPTDSIEERLVSVLRQPMRATQVAHLDLRMSEAREQPRPAPWPRLRFGRKTVLVLAVLTVVPLGAAASGFLGGGTESPHGMVDAAGYREEIEAAQAVVPIPPGSAWPPVTVPPGIYSRDGGRSEVEFVAFCLWSDAWLEAHREGDGAAESQSLRMLKAYRAWVGLDDFADASFRDGIDSVVGAAIAGQPTRSLTTAH
jgi:hypothetical protein